MTSTARRAPWILARCAQAATAVAAAADVFRAAAVRDHVLHATAASQHRSGLVSMVFVDLMTVAVVLVLTVANRTDPGSVPLLVLAEALMITAAVLLVLVIERVTTLQGFALGDTAPAARLGQA
ncbi:hypothetical protein [Streptomyces longwoodensis]|uniref:hypothetical protein n=1 Tax=Streptomyces longwoodensis TaxID=68231 RepID=UPI002250A44A|nr:hypothetical protein [Streptomyces longwoodensis]MCX4996591.1 hypothetical protein [Streptomyces longwoodensis]